MSSKTQSNNISKNKQSSVEIKYYKNYCNRLILIINIIIVIVIKYLSVTQLNIINK